MTPICRGALGFELLGEGKEGAAASPSSARTANSSSRSGSRPTAYAPAAAGLHHLALSAGAIEEVRAYEERLRELGVECAYEGVVAHGEGAACGGIFFHDPDGTRLEISVPVGAEDAPAPISGAPTCGFFQALRQEAVSWTVTARAR
ncbi:VOC family protein [Streptomyces sp. NPDC050448]|uniref:VOC family protein n=1 Tax=Streptomyces sp. NPDC050448 TaxID=3155404 RepID=UPI003431B2B5